MPPVRTLSAPPKPPMKTERTHEENQERAYIAASRRSDRSLEARVESARRASEIHKRRTGRALRVTEQDVVNEEMYEEEDDGLPMQYKRLAAHLNAGSSGLNSRLAAYLSNHIAMRSALGQAIANSEHQFSKPTNFASVQLQPWAQSPLQLPSADSNQSSQMTQPSSGSYPMSSSNSFIHPSDQPQPSNSADKASSMFNETDNSLARPFASKSERRASEPAHLSLGSGGLAPLAASSSKATSASPTGQGRTAATLHSDAKPGPVNSQYPPPFDSPSHQQNWTSSPRNDLGPLTTAMPREMLMYPGFGFDPNHPFGMDMSGDGKNPQSFPNFGSPDSMQPSQFHPSWQGMNQTLAPSALDANLNQDGWNAYPATSGDGLDAPFSDSPSAYNLDQAYSDAFLEQSAVIDGGGPSRQLTPMGEGVWDDFIDQSSWD